MGLSGRLTASPPGIAQLEQQGAGRIEAGRPQSCEALLQQLAEIG
jgi:hypothetical protein